MNKSTASPNPDAADSRQEREAQVHSVFAASMDAILIIALDGRIVEANTAACQLYGYDLDEMLGLSSEVLMHPDSLYRAGEIVSAIREGRVYESTQLAIRKDGTVFHTEGRAAAFMHGGELHILSMERDISTRIRTEERLREQEEQYRSIFEATSDGLIINDPLRGVVVEANPAVCRMHGYSYDEFIGLHATAFIHPDFHPVFADFVETISDGGTYQTQAIDVRKDGSFVHVEVHGSRLLYRGRPHILAVVRDISDRVESGLNLERRLKEQTRDLATLLDVSRNVASTAELQPLLGMILDHLKSAVDYDDAGILVRDGGVLRAIGYRGPLPHDVALQLVFPIDERFPTWDVIEQHEIVLIEDVRKSTPLAQKFRNAVGDRMDSEFGYIGTHLAVPMLHKGRVIGALTLSHSEPGHFSSEQANLVHAIAQQAAIAIENARLYREAQNIAAVEERQRLARELHDSVTQALFSITLHARTARLQLEREGIHQDAPLARTIARLGDLTQGALAEMRALIFELRPGALRDEGLVAAVRKHAAALGAREQMSITVLSSVDRLTLEPDAEQHLYRLVQEGLHNVVKHARAGETRVCIDTSDEDDTLTIRIVDNGVGFDVDSLAPGHLGLTTMVERAALAGGTLQVESRPGEGTSISVTLPYARREPTSPA